MLDIFLNNFSGHIKAGILVISVFFAIFTIHLIISKRLHHFATSLLITTGICFTFYGISQGLVGFNVNDIENSLPKLIEGIKTAFLVSVVGVFGAIVLKIFALIFELIFRAKVDENKEYSLADVVAHEQGILDVLSKQISQNEQNLNAQNEMNARLIKAISGNEDSSLLGQIKNLRMDTNDKFSELVREFRSFAATMTENNQKALIEALSAVIKDFNDKLTEQFGENFKELNSAVSKLVLWQENYKNHIESSENLLENISQALSKQSEDYKVLANSTNDFIAGSKEILAVVKNIKEQRELLSTNASSLANVLENLKENLPEIMNKINEFSQASLDNYEKISNENAKLSEHFQRVNNEIISSTSEQRQALLAEFKEASVALQNELKERSAELNEHFSSSQNFLAESINTHLRSLDSEFNSYNERLNTQLIEALNEASKGVNSQMKVLDSELENALKNISNNIASISAQFVNDYQNITNSLNIATNNLLSSLRAR